MNIYITRINGLSLWNSIQYMQYMTSEIAHQLRFKEMGIYCYPADAENAEKRSCRLDGIIAGINAGDIVVVQHPIGNGMTFERELVNRVKAYKAHVAIFIHSLKALICENNRFLLHGTIDLYNQAEVLIVPSYAMRQFLIENGIRKEMKFVIQEMWDYVETRCFPHTPLFCKEIHFTDSEGFEGMNKWNFKIPLKLYGVSSAQGENVYNMKINPNESIWELSRGGLDWCGTKIVTIASIWNIVFLFHWRDIFQQESLSLFQNEFQIGV